MLAIRLTPHLKKLATASQAICHQFVPTDKEEKAETKTFADPLMEEQHTAVRGLVHKYKNRALILLTMNCAAYCRFCTRRRKVSDIQQGLLTDNDMDNMIAYIKKHPEIKEAIISGGDPLTVPVLLKKLLTQLTRLPQIKIIRVGTRLHAVAPSLINRQVIDALKVVKKQPLYLMVHFEHPDELTPATIVAVKKLQGAATMLLSQSIFLKGVNDNYPALFTLFSRLIEIGVKPYYIFHCDLVKGAERFIVKLEKEITIMTKLRKTLTGIAYPTHVIDAPNGNGKIPVPLNFWECKTRQYQDFEGKTLKSN